MSGRHALPLPEPLQFLEGEIEPAEVEQRVQQHRAVTGRQDETVPIGPGRLLGIESQLAGPEMKGVVGRPHRQAGVAAAGLLHRIDSQRLDGVDGEARLVVCYRLL